MSMLMIITGENIERGYKFLTLYKNFWSCSLQVHIVLLSGRGSNDPAKYYEDYPGNLE